MPSNHVWRFFRAGALDQVELSKDDDFVNLENLDPKLWVAISCPTTGLELDQKTLDLIDTDKDGRIRLPEITAAVNHVVKHLKSPSEIIKGTDGLPLDSINSTPDGKALLISARQILKCIGKDATVLTVSDVSDSQKIFSQTQFNGDGIITPDSANDGATRQVIEEIITVLGGDMDRNGKSGINQAKSDSFHAALREYSDWWKSGESQSQAGIGMLSSNETAAAVAACQTVRLKIDDYFTRCRLTGFDPRSAEHMDSRLDPDSEAIKNDLAKLKSEIAALPLQQVEPGRPLDLATGINPEWADAVKKFRTAAVEPMLGRETLKLTEQNWSQIRGMLNAHEEWVGAKKGVVVEKLGIVRVREILAGGSGLKINELIKQDLALAPEFAGIENVTRLVHYYRDLNTLLKNYVNFSNFYDPNSNSIFNAGKLYLDQRTCHLCIRVDDPGAHAAIAALSKLYLAYCNCTRPTGEKMTIVAAFTQGDSDYLMAGRRGVFYDRKGRDWDALIVKVLENPISIRQAFFSPYKRLAKFIEDQIEKFAEAKDKDAAEHATAGIVSASQSAQSGKSLSKEAFDVAKFAGIFAAIGLAIGAIGGALGAMLTAFASLQWWQMPLAVGGIMLVISGPSMLLAALKLRLRTLGPVLEANGWAINGRVKINIPLGTSLTEIRKLPKNARVSLHDPFEDKRGHRQRLLLAFLLFLAALAYFSWRVILPHYLDLFPMQKPRPPAPLAQPAPTR